MQDKQPDCNFDLEPQKTPAAAGAAAEGTPWEAWRAGTELRCLWFCLLAHSHTRFILQVEGTATDGAVQQPTLIVACPIATPFIQQHQRSAALISTGGVM